MSEETKVTPETKAAPETFEQKADALLEGIAQIEQRYGSQLEDAKKEFSQLGEVIEEQKRRLEAIENAGPAAEGLEVLNEYYPDNDEGHERAFSDWMTDLYNRSLGFESRAGQDTTTAKGGATVPTPLDNQIVHIIEQHGVARRVFDRIPMTSLTLKIPVDTAGPSVTFEDEDATITASSATFRQVTLEAKKLAAVDELTMEIQQDAIRPLVPYLTQLFGEAISKKEDDACFVDTSPFTGIFTETAAASPAETEIGLVQTSGTNASTLSYNDLVDTMHAIDENLVFDGTWLMNHNVLARIRKLLDQDDNPIWSPLAGGEPATILGRPYVIANRAPAGVDGSENALLMYGQWSYGVIGERMGVEVAFSEHAGFTKANTFMRVIERFAYATLKPNAFAVLKTAT